MSAPLRRLARNALVRHGALIFVAQNTANVLAFVFHVIVSRRLGVAPYGALNALLAGLAVIVVPSAILTLVVVKYAAEFHALGDRPRLRALVFRIAGSLGAVGVAILALGVFAAAPVAGYLHVPDLSVELTLAVLALSLPLSVMRGVLQGVEDFRALGATLILEAVAKITGAVVFTALGWGLNGALGAVLLGSVMAALVTLGLLWWRYRGVAGAPLRLDYRRLLQTGGGVAAASLCVTSLLSSDVIIVKHVFDPETAGLYGVTSLAGKMLYYVVGFVGTVLLPRAVNVSTSGRSAVPILLQAMGIVALFTGLGLLLYALVPARIVGMLSGNAFLGAAPLLLYYGIATTLLAATNIVVLFKIGIHRFGFVAPLTAVAVLELIAIAIFHRTPLQVIQILIVADAVALIATLVEIRVPRFATAASLGEHP